MMVWHSITQYIELASIVQHDTVQRAEIEYSILVEYRLNQYNM